MWSGTGRLHGTECLTPQKIKGHKAEVVRRGSTEVSLEEALPLAVLCVPIATETNHHKFRSLNQHKFIILQLYRLE